MTWLQDAINNAQTIVTWCWNFITSNAYLQMLLVISIIPIGFYVFSSARNAVGAGNKNE